MAWGVYPADERWSLEELTRAVSRHADQDGDLVLHGGSGARNRRLRRLNARLRDAGHDTFLGTDGRNTVLHVAGR